MSCDGTGHCDHSPCPHESKSEAITYKQGWSVETQLELAQRFIEEKGLYTEYEAFLEEIAQEENDEAANPHG